MLASLKVFGLFPALLGLVLVVSSCAASVSESASMGEPQQAFRVPVWVAESSTIQRNGGWSLDHEWSNAEGGDSGKLPEGMSLQAKKHLYLIIDFTLHYSLPNSMATLRKSVVEGRTRLAVMRAAILTETISLASYLSKSDRDLLVALINAESADYDNYVLRESIVRLLSASGLSASEISEEELGHLDLETDKDREHNSILERAFLEGRYLRDWISYKWAPDTTSTE